MLIPFNHFALVIGEDLYQRKGSIAKSLEFQLVRTLCLPCPALLAWPPGIWCHPQLQLPSCAEQPTPATQLCKPAVRTGLACSSSHLKLLCPCNLIPGCSRTNLFCKLNQVNPEKALLTQACNTESTGLLSGFCII